MLARLRSAITPPPAGGLAEAQRHLDSLTKPPGSLGRPEEIAAPLAAPPRGAPNPARGPAMTRAQALQALETGARLAEQALDAGADLLATGEMGIGNTTAASAIAAAITGAGPERVTGRGTGVDDATLARK